jgi:hypothetical protein
LSTLLWAGGDHEGNIGNSDSSLDHSGAPPHPRHSVCPEAQAQPEALPCIHRLIQAQERYMVYTCPVSAPIPGALSRPTCLHPLSHGDWEEDVERPWTRHGLTSSTVGGWLGLPRPNTGKGSCLYIFPGPYVPRSKTKILM